MSRGFLRKPTRRINRVPRYSFQRVWQVGKDTLCVTQIPFSQRFKTAEYFAKATQNLAKWQGPQQDKRFGKGRYHPNGRRSSQENFCKNWQPNSQLFLSGALPTRSAAALSARFPSSGRPSEKPNFLGADRLSWFYCSRIRKNAGRCVADPHSCECGYNP